jgi:hypothetical protein
MAEALAKASEPAAPPIPDDVASAVDALQSQLWAAAEVVAEAASEHTPPPPVAAPAPLPIAELPPEPVPEPPAVPEVEPAPKFMTNLRNAPDSLQWAVFGGTAAFLGVIWVAIWFAVGK